MAKSYYSTVLQRPAGEVWAAIRDFSRYAWAGVVSETRMEDGKAGDAVGGVRQVRTGERSLRQRLLAHSDVDRFYTYELCDPSPFPVRNYQATLRVTPVVDGDRAFVEWWATFDCAGDDSEQWKTYFEKDGFAKWLAALRASLEASSPGKAAP